MKALPLSFKFIIAILWDIFDFTIGRIPGLGSLLDIIGMVIALMLWGPLGILALLELVDVTDQLDAEIPSVTLIGIISVMSGRAI